MFVIPGRSAASPLLLWGMMAVLLWQAWSGGKSDDSGPSRAAEVCLLLPPRDGRREGKCVNFSKVNSRSQDFESLAH